MPIPVLVCDDSLVARKQVIKCLTQISDFECYQAENGQKAIAFLKQHDVALLCLDLTMPVLDGLAVLQWLKQTRCECFCIVISADIQPQMKQRVMESGAIEFINKPVNLASLEACLHKFGIY